MIGLSHEMCLRLVFVMTMCVLFFSVGGLEIRPKVRRTDSVVGLGDVLMKSFRDSVRPGHSEKERRANLALIHMMRRTMKKDDDWVNEDVYKSDSSVSRGSDEHEETESRHDGGETFNERGSEHDRGEAPAHGQRDD